MQLANKKFIGAYKNTWTQCAKSSLMEWKSYFNLTPKHILKKEPRLYHNLSFKK